MLVKKKTIKQVHKKHNQKFFEWNKYKSLLSKITSNDNKKYKRTQKEKFRL